MIRTTAPLGSVLLSAALLGMAAALSLVHAAGPAHATGPECTDVGVSTRVCVRGPGHTGITTSPDPAFTNPYPGWGFETLGYPPFGLWIGF